MNGEKQIQKAYAAILKQDFEQAIGWFLQAIALDPNNAAYHYKISITYARSNKLSKAIEHAGKAIELDPDYPQYTDHLRNLQAKQFIIRAKSYFDKEQDQLHLAEALLKQAIQLDPLAAEGYLLLAASYAGLEEYAKAVQTLNDLLKLDPHHEIGIQLLQTYKDRLQQFFHKNTNETS